MSNFDHKWVPSAGVTIERQQDTGPHTHKCRTDAEWYKERWGPDLLPAVVQQQILSETGVGPGLLGLKRTAPQSLSW